MRLRVWCLALVLIETVAASGLCQAGVVGRATREAAERVIGRLGRGAAPEAVGCVSRRVEGLVARHGDDAARALVRHGRLAGPVIAELGAPAARALAAVSPRNARRLAMMTEAGELARVGRTGEVLGVVGRSGDRAMDFVWRLQGALAVSAVLSAFLADPGPFLDGSRDLAGVAAWAAVGAVTGVPGRVADESGRRPDWTLVAVARVAVVTAAVALNACRT